MAKKFEDYKVGDTFSWGKTVTETDVVMFAGITGDFNPLHINEEIAKKSFFKGRIIHGLLIESIMGAAGAQYFQGAYLGHTMNFKAPGRIGDTITANIEIVKIREDKQIITYKNTATNQDGVVLVEGECVIKYM